MRSIRLTRPLTALLIAALASPALAQSPDLDLPKSDRSGSFDPSIDLSYEPEQEPASHLATADGFVEIPVTDHYDSKEREIVDKKFMSGIAPKGQVYGFSFANYDLDGDGFKDLVLTPKGVQFEPPKGIDSPLTFVYLFDGKNWKLALTSGAMWVGVRPSDPNEPDGLKDIAFAQENSVLRYRLVDGKFVELK